MRIRLIAKHKMSMKKFRGLKNKFISYIKTALSFYASTVTIPKLLVQKNAKFIIFHSLKSNDYY